MNAFQNEITTVTQAQVEIAANEILDVTVECKLSERAQFERFAARLASQRAKVAERFAPRRTEVQKFARLTEAL